MLIKSLAGNATPTTVRTNTELISVTKGFGALIIASQTNPQEMTEEKISIYVEKATGNKYIAQDVLLKDFIALTTHGEDAIHKFDDLYHSICELTEDGGFIDLNENETIKVQLSKILETDKYKLYGFEEPVATKELLKFERKIMASESLLQDYDVKGYDLLSLEKNSDLQEVQFTFDNSAVTTCLPVELEIFCRSLDAGTLVAQGGVMAGVPNRLLIPLKGIVGIKIKKDAGAILNLHLRIDESDWDLYQKNNH